MTVAPPITWPLPTSFQPRPYQLDALARCVERNTALDHGLGAGKTTTALAAAEALGAMRVLVLCPKKVVRVWQDEVTENAAREWVVWAGWVPGVNGKPLKDPSIPRRIEAIRVLDRMATALRQPMMTVVNYEATHQGAMRKFLLAEPWEMMICDESQHLARPGSATSKFTKRLGATVRARGGRVLLTTGTFMPHSALSTYAQMRTLQPDVLGTSWAAFKARYAKYKVLKETQWCPYCVKPSNRPVGAVCGANGDGIALESWETPETTCGGIIERGDPILMLTPNREPIPDGVREDRAEELMARLAPWVHRVSQDELDAQTGLVEAIPQLRTCVLSPVARSAYDALERDMVSRVADGTIVSANAMTNASALLRLACGHAKMEETGEIVNLAGDGQICDLAKLLADELDEHHHTEPIVVFYQWRFDADQIKMVCEEQGRRYGELSGRTSSGLDGKWMHPKIDVLAVQWQAGSEGLNFSRSHHEIDYSFGFSLTPFTQGPRRLNRQGQQHAVTRRVLVAENTVNLNAFYALKQRRRVNEAILNRLGGTT